MERITMHYAVVRNAYCPPDSRSRVSARTREELWTKILDGQRDGLYGDVIHTWEEEAYDPEEWAAEQAELRRIRLTSCVMPPESDLRLLSWAKSLGPERYAEIQPKLGSWKRTRQRLDLIRNEKLNEYIRAQWLGKT